MDIKVEPSSGSDSDPSFLQGDADAPDTDSEETEVSYVFPEVKCEIKVSSPLSSCLFLNPIVAADRVIFVLNASACMCTG